MSREVGTILYRAECYEVDSGTESNRKGFELHTDEYVIDRITTKGMWLRPTKGGMETWRSFGTKFARSTEEQAMKDLRRRAIRHRHYSRGRTDSAEQRLEYIEERLKRWCE